ncbi:MAG: flavin reductase [Chloroflexi bacterium]|nr:flavin reductase [Chloroflexota bacterium]
MFTATQELDVAVDTLYYRRVMRRLATGVTVVTVRDGNFVHGMTANTFTSVSLTPTLVLISVMRSSTTHEFITRARNFAVNILSAAQRPLAERFAHQVPMPPEPFGDIAYHEQATGAPIFDDCIAYVDCRLVAAHDAGDHTLFIGEVVDLGFGHSKDAAPLLWLDGKYTSA